MRIMVKLGAAMDKGVDKEDLRGQRGDPRETLNGTQVGELLAFSKSHLIYRYSVLGGARESKHR